MKNFIFIGCSLIVFSAFGNAQISIIANKSISASSISKEDAANIYSLDVREVGGTKVKLFTIQSDGAVRDDFFGALGKNAVAIRKVWMQKQLTGNGTAPENVSDEDAMLAKVSSTPGSIGFISSSKVTGGVKVLLVLH